MKLPKHSLSVQFFSLGATAWIFGALSACSDAGTSDTVPGPSDNSIGVGGTSTDPPPIASSGGTSGGGGTPANGGSPFPETGGTGPTVETTEICGSAEEGGSLSLSCAEGATITALDFASYGDPGGECGNYVSGSCHASGSIGIVEGACLGKESCIVEVSNETFGGDPCSFVQKHLSVQATCTDEEPRTGTGGELGSGGAAGTGGSSVGGSTGGNSTWNEGTELKAFPTAEGYGRLAKGGRGGRVIKVTNLNDSGPGSLRDAIEQTGPRTVIFDIGGTLRLESKLQIKAANKELTIAGQTAPGSGITIRDYAFGTTGSEDFIVRFIRTRVGTTSGITQDGMGLTASNNAIMDHCSISWTMDEGFSSRQAHNITLQRTLISECLNDAGHSIQQSPHGYAASINGDIGSFHRNLLAHCVGRNWSLAGGLKGGSPVTAIGRLDIRNNVVYNWQNRTTDGETYQVNFVNNYYKPGPATTHEYAISLEFYEIAENLPQYFVRGNVMLGVFTAEEVEESYRYPTEPPGDYWATEELWDPHVETVTADEAYDDVLTEVGANVPMLDDHDTRILQEVRDGTYAYSGSRTGLPGHIDNEADAGGHEEFPVVERPADWDTDDDGMPGVWETAHGLNPNDSEDRNGTNLSTIGYTNLEMYLNELAGDLD